MTASASSFLGPVWLQWLVLLGGGVAAVGAIWRVITVIIPTVNTLLQLAVTLETIETHLKQLESQHLDLVGRYRRLYHYTHDSIHAFSAHLTAIGLTKQTVTTLSNELARIAIELRDVSARSRAVEDP